jgi:hypothetical protein
MSGDKNAAAWPIQRWSKQKAPDRIAQSGAKLQRDRNLRSRLKRNGFWSIRHFALSFYWSMIFSENRYPLFGIML